MDLQLIFQVFLKYAENIDFKKIILIYVSLIVHELGHVLVAIIMRLKIYKISITVFGFNMQVKTNDEPFNKKTLLYYAGPIANFVFGSLLLYCGELEFSVTSFLLGFINIIPIVPLDGGNALKELLLLIFNRKKVAIIFILINMFFLSAAVACYFFETNNYIYLGFAYISIKGIFIERQLLLEEKIKNSYKELLNKTCEGKGE